MVSPFLKQMAEQSREKKNEPIKIYNTQTIIPQKNTIPSSQKQSSSSATNRLHNDDVKLTYSVADAWQKKQPTRSLSTVRSSSDRLASLNVPKTRLQIAALQQQRDREKAELEKWKSKRIDTIDSSADLPSRRGAQGEKNWKGRRNLLEESIWRLDSRIAQLQRDVYESSAYRNDFDHYSSVGERVKNPSLLTANLQREAYLSGRRPKDAALGNEVTFAENNFDKKLSEELFSLNLAGDKSYQYLTDNERQVYNYVLAKEGRQAAGNYLDLLQEELNQRRGTNTGEQVRSIENSFLRTAATGGYAAKSGLENFNSGVKQYLSEDGKPLPTSSVLYASDYIRDDLGPVGGFFYDAIQTSANMVPSIAASALTGSPLVGSMTLAASAGGNAYNQALKEGYSPAEARNYAALIAASEGAMQYVLGGVSKLGGKMTQNIAQRTIRNIDNSLLRVAADLGVKMAGEGTEEYLQSVLEPAYRNLVFDENNEVKLVSKDAAYSFLLGAITAGILEGGAVVSDERSMKRLGAAVERSGHYGELLEQAQAMEKTTESYRLSSQLSAGSTRATENNIGRLLTTYVKEGGSLEFMKQPAGMEADLSTEDAPVNNADLFNNARNIPAADLETLSTAAQSSSNTNETVQNRIQENMRRGQREAAVLGENGSRAFAKAYDANAAAQLQPEDAVQGFAQIYNAALQGKSLDSITTGKAALLPDYMRVAAEGAGKQDAIRASQAKYFGKDAGLFRDANCKKANLTRKTIRILDAIGKAAGVQIRFAEQVAEGRANAEYDPNTGVLTIALDASDPVRVAFTHEIIHRIRHVSPEAYSALAKFVQDRLSSSEMAFLKNSYQEIYKNSDTGYLTEEIVADAFGYLMGEGAVLEEFVKANRTTAQRILDAIVDFIDSVKQVLKGKNGVQLSPEQKEAFASLQKDMEAMAKTLTTALNKTAKVVQNNEKVGQSRQKNTAQQGDIKFSIKYDRENSPYVVIDKDILAGAPRSEWVKRVKDNLRQKFPDGVTVGNNVIEIDKQSIREMTFSRYTQRLMKEEPELYADKLRATNNADEILRASRNYVNEALAHSRRDSIQEFARGEVLMEIGGNGYSAQVVVAMRSNGRLLLYDLLNLKRADIDKKTGHSKVNTVNPQGGTGSQAVSSNTSISETSGDVNGRFSLKSPMEETKTLIALHNLTESKLLGTLRLGGFPMPSIAVTRTDIPHTNFGEISLVMDKRAIDPKASRKNTVYSADAWTPTFPQVEYEADAQAERRISRRIGELSAQVDTYFQDDLRRLQYGLDDYLNRHGGEEGLARWAMDNYGLKAAYLEEQGAHIEPSTTQREVEKGYNPERADKYQAIADALGTKDPEAIGQMPLKQLQDEYGEALEQAFPGMTKSAFRMSGILRQVQEYFRDQGGEPVYETVTDGAATRRVVDEALDRAGYEQWVRELYSGIEAASGVYNNKELFTPSGNRRTFQQTHYPVTLEGIVKAMAGQNGGNTKNVSGFYGVKSLRAGMAQRFKSIADMHKLEGRLQNLTEEEQQAISDALDKRLIEITGELAEKSPGGARDYDFTQSDNIGHILVEIADSGNYTIDSITRKFNGEYGYRIGNGLAAKVRDLLFDVSQMPVNMFEAKPERAVGFDEVLAAVVPDDSSQELTDALAQAGVRVLEYKSGDDTDRVKQVNSVEGARFSLKKPTAGTRWTIENKILDKKDWAIFYRQIADFNKRGYTLPETKNGEYIVEVGNKLIFTDGDYDAPVITEVIVLHDDNETHMALAKEVIFDEKSRSGGYDEANRFIEISYGKGYASRYDYRDYITDGKLLERREGADRTADLRGAESGGRGGSGQERKSLKETSTLLREIAAVNRQKALEENATIPPGEKPTRTVVLPQRMGNQKLSWTARTILEAGATPEEALPSIEKLVDQGDFSYDEYTDKQALADAEASITRSGWDRSRTEWKNAVRNGAVSKELTAKGWVLYNNAVNSGDTETAMDILTMMVEHQRSAAQAVQATRILKKLSPDSQLYQVQRSVMDLQDELNQRYGEKNAPVLKVDPELGQEFMEAQTQEERDAILRDIYRDIGRQMPSTALDKWNAWRYLAMLGNPRTHVRNVLGNALFVPVVGAKNLTATAMEAAVNKATGGKTGRSKSVLGRKDRSLLDAARADFANVEEAASGTGKYNDAAVMNRDIQDGRVIFKTRTLEKARRANSAALEVEDVLFLRGHYARSLAQYCKANGITAEQVQKGTGKALERARAYAVKEAQKATYRDMNALSNLLSRRFSTRGEFSMGAKVANAAIEGILPFRRTPANILARGIEYSPIGLANGIRTALFDVRRGRASATEAIDKIAAGMTGTGLMALGWYLAAQGVIRGLGAGDDDEREYEELMGRQPYSLEVGGKSYTLDWLAPQSIPFFMGVNLWEQTGGMPEEMNMEAVSNVLVNITDPMLNMSVLQSLNDLLDSVEYAQSGKLGEAVTTTATSYLTQAFPTLLGQLERTLEPVRMTTYTDKNKFLTTDQQYTLGRISARVPGVDYQQIPYIDAWGRTEDSGAAGWRALNNFLNPAYTSTIQGSAMEEELARLYEATGDSGILPSKAPKSFSVDGKTKELTAQEYVEYATERGQTAYDLLSRLAAQMAYQELNDETRVELIGDVYDYANETAKAAVSDFEPGRNSKRLKAVEAAGYDPVEYLLLKAAGEAAGLSSLEVAVTAETDGLASLLILDNYDKQRTVERFTDPNKSGYEYVMNEGQQAEFSELYTQAMEEELYRLLRSSEYQRANTPERKEMVSEAQSEVNAQVKEDMTKKLQRAGVRSEKKD